VLRPERTGQSFQRGLEHCQRTDRELARHRWTQRTWNPPRAVRGSLPPPTKESARIGILRRVAHKFGGSSLADAARFRAVAELLRARPEPEQVVVVSAIQGVTDALLRLAHDAAADQTGWREACAALRERHRTVADELLGGAAAEVQTWLDARFDELAGLLHGLSLLRIPAPETVDRIQGLGEVFSARLLCAHFAVLGSPAALLDARDVLVVQPGELGVAVDWEESARRLSAWRADHPEVRVVVTGFLARDARGSPTTLGRNGSDYSGSIFGALFGAEEIQIWTDVDGILSADPRLVPEAVLIPHLSYDEACELAYFGAKVVHPQTMAPAIARGIPLRIRNTFRPEHPGTRIDAEVDRSRAVKGISTMPGLALLNVEGAGMIGVPGTAERVFGSLRAARVSVVMISQGSSEHSICCVVRASEAVTAETALRESFARELERGHIERITLHTGISALATVGDGMAGTPGIAARLFQSLARPGVNVRAIAQGASERNISVAIASADAPRALRAVHAGFYLSPQTVSLGVVGPGQVGRAFLRQLDRAGPRLRSQGQLDLRVRAAADSRWMVLEELALAPAEVPGLLAAAALPADLDQLARHVRASHLPHAVMIDCSASNAVADAYARWLAQGIHVITPNKHAGSGPLERYRALRRASAEHGARFRYEATVGAGLPIITTLRDLLDTGDEVLSIEGILSGTLAYLFNRFDGQVPFSALVREARAAGYTEPDPREDLSGMDVARKLVILGREMDSALELSSVSVESLVPPGLQALSREDFLERLPDMDQPLAARLAEVRRRGRVLRYVARLDRAGAATVGLTELPADHPFAHGQATDNVVRFTTARYREQPLVVQGPGAGPEVTAAGVFADLLRITTALGVLP
jgi:bifunctional aspartokinase / homoserine dehydrogenase 1